MVRMFSLNDLAKGCMQIENPEVTPNNEQGSDPIICRSEFTAAEENADTYNITHALSYPGGNGRMAKRMNMKRAHVFRPQATNQKRLLLV